MTMVKCIIMLYGASFVLHLWLIFCFCLGPSLANKFWSGVLESYYLPRASTYFSRLSRSLRQNEKFKLQEWRKEWILQSNKWQEGNELYPVKAKGNALAISKALYEKYCAK